jgi:hypothetical protein
MAEAAPDNSASRKIVDVDDLFQILIVRGVPPRDAKRQITEFLQLGKVLIDSHIAAGARKSRPTRQATDEELKAQYDEQSKTLRDLLRDPATAGLSNQELGRRVGLRDGVVAEFRRLMRAGGDEQSQRGDLHAAAATAARSPHMMDLDFLYERSPPGGITGAVDPSKWDVPGVFSLAIIDGHLVIEPQCSLDFPWQSYSFWISNPVVINELFPAPAAANPTPASNPTSARSVEGAPRPPPGATSGYGQLVESGREAGLRGKKLLQAVCAEVGPKFTASPGSMKKAKQRYRQKHRS